MSHSFENADRAAKLSWVLALATLAYSVVTNNAKDHSDMGRIIALANATLVLILMLIGVSCAIYALCGVAKQGRRGILIPGLVGLILNGLFLGLFTLGVILAIRPPAPIAPWQNVVSDKGTYQVEIMGNVTRKLSSSGNEQNGFVIHRIEGKSFNGRVLMSAEQITYPPIHGFRSSESIINPLIEETLAHRGGQETRRDVIDDNDSRIVISARMTDPPGVLNLVVRREANVVYFLTYAANDHVINQADAERFFDSFERLETSDSD